MQSEKAMKKIFVIETDVFILPIFQQMGSFCTGKQVENNSDVGWLTLNRYAGESESVDFYENCPHLFNKIGAIPLSHDLSTPFIPLISPSFFSNGYGNIFSITTPIKQVREATQKAITDKFRTKIELAKKQRLGRKIFKRIKKEKSSCYNGSDKQYPAYTNLGILWKEQPTNLEQEIILNRAETFAEENNFKILNAFLLDFEPKYVNLLKETI